MKIPSLPHTLFPKILPILCLALFNSVSLAAERQYTIEFKITAVPRAWSEEKSFGKVPQEIDISLFKELHEVDGVDMLSTPKVITLENQDARIEIRNEALTYMEKAGDVYIPKRMPEGTGPGISIAVKVADLANNPGYSLLDMEASIVTLTGRKPLPIGLDVGMPILNKQEITSSLTCFNGKWHLVANLAPQGSGEDKPLLVFARVEAKAKGTDTKLPLNISADKLTQDKGSFRFEGNVQIHSGGLEIYSDSIVYKEDAGKGAGPGIQADQLTFDEPGGRVTLKGNVQFRTEGGVIHAEQLKLQQVAGVQVKRESALEKKLKAIIIPSLDFKDVSLGDAVDFVRKASKQKTADGHGVNILIKPNALCGQGVSMSLRNLSLYHVLKYLAESSDNTMHIDEEAGMVVIGL